MRILIALMVLSGFCFKSSGIVYKRKANNLGVKRDQSYNMLTEEYEERRERYFLDEPREYPWGVCFQNWKLGFGEKHRSWTLEAMKRWNEQYLNFHKGKPFLRGVPDPEGTLFVLSCDKTRYYLIFPVFGDVPENVLAYHQNTKPWLFSLYGNIVMSNKEVWERPHFINVMMHELGHALGLPHLEPYDTEIMASNGFFCETDGQEKICNLTVKDFNTFIAPFPSFYTSQEHIDAMRRMYEYHKRNMKNPDKRCFYEEPIVSMGACSHL